MTEQANQHHDSDQRVATNEAPSFEPETQTDVTKPPSAEPKRFQAAFPAEGITCEICVADSKVVSCDLHRVCSTRISLFSTSNNRGKHLFPTLRTKYCSVCGHREHEFVPHDETTVHVIGPIELDEADAAYVDEKLAENVTRGWQIYGRRYVSGHGWQDTSDDPWDDYDATFPDSRSKALPGPRKDGKQAPYVVLRRGRHVATIGAAEMERLVAENPDLEVALGWAAPETDDDQEATDDASE